MRIILNKILSEKEISALSEKEIYENQPTTARNVAFKYLGDTSFSDKIIELNKSLQ
jgi:hypothetical protein